MEKLQQWERIKEIVGSALELEPAERIAFLEKSCSQDSHLRAEVESLLAAYGSANGFSSHPWAALESGAPIAELGPIGPYRLLTELGVGGMGHVWLAEQTEPVRRRVALKLIKAGMYDPAMVRRFEAERQSLAIMDHPSIAKVFEAGATSAGQPYFVMEYVDGPCITEYCDSKNLGIRERLQLFIRVCEGVQHAHQKAVIHRDLKPSNILVVEVDGTPTPRIIDFGLAKTALPMTSGETLLTHVGSFLGTPGYMSPEQASGDHDIDTRTDVYSLGAILYELLTGSLPFETARSRTQAPEEFLRQLREDDPPTPSARVSTYRNISPDKAHARNMEPRQLARALRGELDWIAMKSLEKDRERRYATPSELAGDIDNFLHHRPVNARAAKLSYRLRKYVRRHAAGVAVVAAALTLLVTFATMQAAELRRITRERNRADRITEFMTSMFNVSDPSEARGSTVTAREILDKSSREINTGLASDPELQTQLLNTMGNVYVGLGLFSRAQTTFQDAIRIGHHSSLSTSPATLAAMSGLSSILLRQGKYSEAEKLLRDVIDGQRRVLGSGHESTLRSRRLLATTVQREGRLQEAETLQREALVEAQRTLGPAQAETLLSMNELANILDRQGRMPEAEAMYRQTLEIQRRTMGPDHPQTLVVASNLAGILGEQDRLEEAEKLERDVLSARMRLLGPEHPDTLQAEHTLANNLDYGGQYTEAVQFFRQILASQRRVLGVDHAETLKTMHNLAATLGRAGNRAEAETLQRETLAGRSRVLGPDHPDTLDTMGELAITLSYERKFEEAQKLLSVLATAAKQRKDREVVSSALYYLACGAAIAGRPDQAIDYLQQSIANGFADILYMKRDPDLKTLHSEPRFAKLIHAAENSSAGKPN